MRAVEPFAGSAATSCGSEALSAKAFGDQVIRNHKDERKERQQMNRLCAVEDKQPKTIEDEQN